MAHSRSPSHTAKPSQAKRSQALLPSEKSSLPPPFVRREPILTWRRQPDNHRHFASTFIPRNKPLVRFASREVTWIAPSQQRWPFDYSTTPTAHGAQGRHRVSETLGYTTRFRSSSWLLPLTTSPKSFQFTLESRRSIALRRLLSPFTF